MTQSTSGSLFTLTKYSHFFKITRFTPQIRHVVEAFKHRYTLKSFVPNNNNPYRKNTPDPPPKVYVGTAKRGHEFRMHINQLPEFKQVLENANITPNLYTEIEVPLFEPERLTLSTAPGRIARENQEPVIEFCAAPDGQPSKMVPAGCGFGKGTISTFAAHKLGSRLAVIVKASFVEKWVEDIRVNYAVGKYDIITAQGSKELKGLIQLARDGRLVAQVVIVSMDTYDNFIKAYEFNPLELELDGYECVPERFFETLKVGTVILDEVHIDFMRTFRFMLYTHVPRILALSATLTSTVPFMEKVYKTVFPMDCRYTGLAIDRYIETYAVAYRFKDPSKIRTSDYGCSFYSHHAFEKSIYHHKPTCTNYLEMIVAVIEMGYRKHYKRGNKLAVFAQSKSFCTEITRYLKQKYPMLDVRRFIDEDPYENLIDSDIRVTTILSGGTGHDIPGLTDVILTINIDSIQSNLQTLGRLRKLKDQAVRFWYLYAENIQKHQQYNKRRKTNIQGNVKFIKDIFYPKSI